MRQCCVSGYTIRMRDMYRRAEYDSRQVPMGSPQDNDLQDQDEKRENPEGSDM